MIYPVSGGNKYAAIYVQYPEGSELSCSNGNRTLRAETTTGKWVFLIPYAGTWTVTATKGTAAETASKTVGITAKNQVVDLTLTYDFVLFSYGDYNKAQTGGWVKKAWKWATSQYGTAREPAISEGTDYFKFMHSQGGSQGAYYVSNKIDFTNYNKLVFTGEVGGENSSNPMGFFIFTDLSATNAGDSCISKIFWTNLSAKKTFSNSTVLDVSAIKKACYIGIYMTSTDDKYITVKDLRLVP